MIKTTNRINLKNHWLLLMVFMGMMVFSQNPTRIYQGFTQTNQQLEVITNEGTYRIKPYNNFIVETSFIPNGETFNPNSHAVVLNPQQLNLKIKQNQHEIMLITNGISVKINKSPFKISYFFKDKELISEKMGYQKSEKSFQLDFNITSDEVLFGGGARVLGMNRRGHKLQLYNRA
ncbi:MAG: DUF4968 domain-containing protein, partial [Flavobacteriaceae bacterium]|nr:DUF4968 domain-containing protein [Flavobacteriaceae bacterium]